MSFSDRRRRGTDGSEGRRVEGKYIPSGVNGADFEAGRRTSTVTHPSFNHQQTPEGRDVTSFHICFQMSVPTM